MSPFPTVQVELAPIVGICQSSIQKQAALKEDLRVAKEMLEDKLMADSKWKTLEQTREKLLADRRELKTKLLQDGVTYKLDQKVKEIRAEINEHSEQLSLFLDDYVNITKTYEIDDGTGQKHAIVRRAKIV